MRTRIIAKLDCKPPYVIKPVLFDGVRKVGTPNELAEKYYNEGVDEIIYLDVVSSLYDKPIDLNCISNFAIKKFIPLAVGGGIKSLSDAEKLFHNGADKIVINTSSIETPEILKDISYSYGNQSIVVHIEAKKINGEYFCFTECGRNNSGMKVKDWIKELNKGVAGEILIQSIDFDGLMSGFDDQLFDLTMTHSKIPVILSSGFSSINNIKEAIENFNPSGICVSSILHYDKISLKDLRNNDWDTSN